MNLDLNWDAPLEILSKIYGSVVGPPTERETDEWMYMHQAYEHKDSNAFPHGLLFSICLRKNSKVNIPI